VIRLLAFALVLAGAAGCGAKLSEPGVATPAPESGEVSDAKPAKCPEARPAVGYDWSRPVEKWWTLGDAACPDHGKLEETQENGAKAQKCMLGQTPHGPVVSWHLDGTTKRWEGFYLFGNQHGLWRGWYENGNQNVEMNYRNGTPHGPYVQWYDDGKVNSEGEYSAGSRVGKWVDNWPSGKLHTRSQMKEGQYDGLYEEFYEDGTRRLTVPYKAGRVDGQVVRYSPAGAEIASFAMENGTGTYREWHDNGGLALEQDQIQGRPSGKHVRYYESGKKAEEGGFNKSGGIEGTWLHWSEKGDLVMRQEYEGPHIGRTIQYENGKVNRIDDNYFSGYRKSSVGYDGNKKQGTATNWHDGSGSMSSKGSYDKDKKVGRWLVWDRNGELTAVEIYKRGRLTKKEKPKPVTIAPEYATSEPLCDLMIEEILTCNALPPDKLTRLKTMIANWKERLGRRDWVSARQDVQAECEDTRTRFREVRESVGCKAAP
jgi:antitoxin component YwqK of YwqJK toxin-antitoxin module